MSIRACFVAIIAIALASSACGRTSLDTYSDVPRFDGDSGRVDVSDRDVPPDSPPIGCRTNSDCASTPATPVCDTTTSRCVECLTSPDNCPRGQLCDGTVHRCVPGCRTDMDCNRTNPRCRTDTHQCVACLGPTDCSFGERCVNYQCIAPCRGGACPGTQVCCSDVCINVQNDPANCGGCGIVCGSIAHGTSACTGSRCGIGTCDPGYADCDGLATSGCEANLAIDPGNCGGCGVRCGIGQVCTGGLCETPNCTTVGCSPGLTCCSSACTPTSTDPNNCGGCGIACNPIAHGAATCNAGSCAVASCDPGFGDCDGFEMNGCETDTRVDPRNCGSCGNACGPSMACSAGVCVPLCGGGPMCPPGTTCCNNMCAFTSSDVNNCGGCRNVCPIPANATAACNSGTCGIGTCSRGWGDCNSRPTDGCETNLQTDVNNCGGCGVRCAAGATCVSGSCRASTTCPAVPCGPNEGCCGGTCRVVQNDPNNCGGCDVICPASAPICMGTACCTPGPGGVCGAMICPGGQTNCAGVCVTLSNDPNNCGGCAIRCAAGQTCVGGFCQSLCGGVTCTPGTTCCGSACVSTASDPNNCGACGRSCIPGQTCVGGTCTGCGFCAPGTSCCGSACINTQTDPNNCGGCGLRCGVGQMCVAGTCVGGCGICPPGTSCCGTSCVSLTADPNNCGGCGIVCPPRANAVATCSGATCGFACNAGFGNCNGSTFDGCESPLNTTTNCGRCGNACLGGANGTAVCTSTGCGVICNTGFGNCDGNPSNGCEAPLNTNTNCGGCGIACGTGRTCMGGTCVVTGCNGGPACATGQTCCSTGCQDLTSNASNCGACGRVCNLPNATSSCVASACAVASCNMGFGDCDGVASNGCESNLQTDPMHCGTCTTGCGSGLTCTAGVCQPPSTGSEGAFMPIVNPTVLTPGVHNFTTITVPAGVVVYVAGAGAQSGTLDLRATGHIQIDGTIDVSGGPGTQAIVASSATQQGRAGNGGNTGEVSSVATSMPNCEFDTGVPGARGPAVMGTSGTCTALAPTACLSRSDPGVFIFSATPAQYGGGAGVFTGYRAYGSGGGGYAGGAGGALGATFTGESDCRGVTAGGGATGGNGGRAMSAALYDGGNGTLGQTQCDASMPGIPRAWVGGGGGGSIGPAAAADLAVATTFYAGSGGGGGSADYLQRPAFGGSSGGGGGGGVLRLWTPADIVVTGRLLANGGAGGDAYLGTPAGAGCDPQPGSAGGGGSGGLIYLEAPSITTAASAQVSAVGGRGGVASVFATAGAGGAGGLGRIRISVTPTTCSLAGTFSPALVSGCTPATATAGRAYLATYPN